MVDEIANAEDKPQESQTTYLDSNIDEIEAVEAGSLVNFTGYEGMRVKIVEVKEKEVVDPWTGPEDATGKPTYNQASTEKKHQIEVETEQLPIIDAEGNVLEDKETIGDKPLTVKSSFNLKKENDRWVISKAPSAALWKFMRKLGVTKLSELKGKTVTLTTDTSDDGRVWLRIVR